MTPLPHIPLPYEYLTSSGVKYSFSGWTPGESPLECWDRGDWLKCLHGCMLCLSLNRNLSPMRWAIEDDGLLHELVHLALGIEICHHSTMENLRVRVEQLQELMAELPRWRKHDRH